jgi:hypothetical protein
MVSGLNIRKKNRIEVEYVQNGGPDQETSEDIQKLYTSFNIISQLGRILFMSCAESLLMRSKN